ncbi:hypothetical protein SUBVAR_05789 [Subdoligranulum variabile DSM 15176]|uniref:Uncharacterized protein n=1 Tax=Subdoligranulum variabile DSM 15176 TaxID=411471 RepID=D1PN74_9FIRM|nr:hypothetical protein SUBVAR_05789 [Subdoligranulum variabile DSM 15176]
MFGLDAVDGILGPYFPAIDRTVRPGAEGVDVGAGRCAGISAAGIVGTRIPRINGAVVLGRCLFTGRIIGAGQGHAAVAAAGRARFVVGAAVGADGRMGSGLGFGAEFRFPLKTGSMLGLMHADADFLPAGAVVGGAAFGANDDVVIVGKSLFTDRTVISSVTCHVYVSSQ